MKILLLSILMVSCFLLVQSKKNKKDKHDKHDKHKPPKEKDCSESVLKDMDGYLEAWRDEDWDKLVTYYDKDMMYFRGDNKPTAFGPKAALQNNIDWKKAVPNVDMEPAMRDISCTDHKTAVGMCIAQTTEYPDRYTRALLVWRRKNRSAKWKVFREAFVGIKGNLKSDEEFARWDVPSAYD